LEEGNVDQQGSAFITGRVAGIGTEIFRAFVAQHARFGFVDLDANSSAALAEEIGGETAFAQCGFVKSGNCIDIRDWKNAHRGNFA
jgi:NADP-dependent 3-hydroxy acid dehydrogenase YdfG